MEWWGMLGAEGWTTYDATVLHGNGGYARQKEPGVNRKDGLFYTN
jgi:hypothetical protein